MLINGLYVEAYPDNDGGLWYYHPVTGRATTVNEDVDNVEYDVESEVA